MSAGDWIKMRVGLWDSPQIVRMASLLKTGKATVCGALYRLWCLGDQYTTDGRLVGYTAETLDDAIGVSGFSEALQSVGWLCSEPDGVTIPNFGEHNGQSAKRRAQERDRMRVVRNSCASDANKKRTRGRGRREGELEEEGETEGTFDDDGALRDFEEKRRELLATIKRIAQRVKCRHHNDRSLAVKVARLTCEKQFSPDDIEQSLESVRLKAKDKPAAWFHRCLENKARDFGRDFRQMLASVQIDPADIDATYQEAMNEG